MQPLKTRKSYPQKKLNDLTLYVIHVDYSLLFVNDVILESK